MQSSSTHHNIVCYGEILWDVLPDKSLPGGAPMNVAYHLKKLGSHPVLISRIGEDALGRELIHKLCDNGLVTDYVQVDDKHKTGVVYAHQEPNNEMVYDIVHPVAWDFIGWQNEFSQLIETASFFVYGSLTSRSKTSRDTMYQLLEGAKTKVLDINLRPPHFQRTGIEYLLYKADVLKMNLAELELIAGWFSRSADIEERISLVQDRFLIDTVIVTMGANGALVNDKGTVCRHHGFKVTVADTIGSGDAFFAGFLHQLQSGASIETALDFASAIGAFMATQPGACPDYEIAQITDLVHSNFSIQPQTQF